MTEVWRDIDGFNGRYKVSNFGNIKTKKRCRSTGNNYMTPFISTDGAGQRGGGYFRICLTLPNGKQKKYQVHRLVASAFIPNPENKPHINHINSVRNDNRVTNLEWCTPKENAMHKVKMGRCNSAKGENNASSKLTSPEVKKIKKLLSMGHTQYSVAKKFGVHKVTIFDIKYGNTWKHI